MPIVENLNLYKKAPVKKILEPKLRQNSNTKVYFKYLLCHVNKVEIILKKTYDPSVIYRYDRHWCDTKLNLIITIS